MTKNNISKLSAYWIKASEIDASTARDIFENTTKYVTVLFHIHLAIEKILKAAYVTRKKEHAPYSHNLLYLAKSAEIDLSDDYIKFLSEVNEFNLECRYPDEKFSIYKKANKRFAEKYLKSMEKFREWISERLKKEQ